MKRIIASLLAVAMSFAIASADHHIEVGTEDLATTPTPEGTVSSPDTMMPDEDFLYLYEDYISVYYNGTFIEFEDAVPEIQNGSTFVPIRAFADALGAETGFDDVTRAVTITNGDNVVSFVVGTNEVTVNDEVMTLSANTYISMERTMVPARLISEAFDLEVSWSELTRTVSINDMNALKEGIDTDYTIINQFLASQKYTAESNMLVSGTFDFEFGMDDQIVAVNSTIEAITDKEMTAMNYDMDVSVDLETVIAAYEESMAYAIAEGGEEVETLVNEYIEVIKLLENFTIEYIIDTEVLDVYVKTDVLPKLGPVLLGTDMFENDPWIKISYKDLLTEDDYNSLLALMEQSKSGEIMLDLETIVDYIMNSSTAFPDGVYSGTEAFLGAISDENFDKNGSTYSLDKTFSSGEESYMPYEITINLDLYQNADDSITSYDLTFKQVSDYGVNSFTIDQESLEKVQMDFSMVATGFFGYSITGSFDLESSETDLEPVKVPDGEIITMDDLIYGSLETSPDDVVMP